ncbi:NAD(P)-dependent dehydrogenase (short-subunit alcohol dehydrogenase family) [Sphingobium jiangsuense]|uniref:NAD(P)-dependent dehydrogenase (Short-subunit alcohol dehydrogenase family) n=1 Tax=Sphingobium jiangsuense TaxID=870476 RepID=A0A7W6FQD1_9SPHN|nr:SDR family oxidoreductase [Sphingobium jiangsuense]MBB3926805.1 NAD(P)-dependent dehydrogenase (short-subunit alcohol dehydrogenase family) [Sphingobium jiangsuense]
MSGAAMTGGGAAGRLAGKTALVVGAAGVGNMGQVIARRFAAEGARVAVAGRNKEVLQALADELGGVALDCDFTRRDSIEAMVQGAADALGGLDIAVNATGWGLLKPFLETTDEELDRMYALQLRGPFQFVQALIPVMERRGGGSIIQISSATATIMFHDHAAYMATKAGTDHMIRTVANEFGHLGIRANSISPGVTETPMTAEAQAVPGLMEAFKKGYPLGRYGTSADIAAGCVFLASDECFMTGENLQVNGGLTLRGNPGKADIEASVAAAMAAGTGQ